LDSSSRVCYDDANISPKQKNVPFDTIMGMGTGTYNNTPATVEFRLSDAGEPGNSDRVTAIIRVGSTVVMAIDGVLTGGNNQANKN
jgi:hypothetical protein